MLENLIKVPGRLPYRPCRIVIMQKVDLFRECRPELGKIYEAECYKSKFGAKGYVIQINGKRINIRNDEAIEV